MQSGLTPPDPSAPTTTGEGAPRSNVPQKEETLPYARREGSLLGGLFSRKQSENGVDDPTARQMLRDRFRRWARPAGITVNHPFGSTRRVAPTQPRAELKLTRGELRKPGTPTDQKLVERQRTNVATQAVGGTVKKNAAQQAPDILGDRRAAEHHIAQLFTAGRQADQALPFARYILDSFTYPPQASASFLKPILLAHALANVSKGDGPIAFGALQALMGRDPTQHPDRQRCAFALQCELALSQPGFDAIAELAPDLFQPLAGKPSNTERQIHLEAQTHALRAAHRLLTVWPASEPAPCNLDELCAAAGAALPFDERPSSPWFTPALGEELRTALFEDPVALRGMLCARELIRNPAATPGPTLRDAYFVLRNNIDEQKLPLLKSRLFRIPSMAQAHVRSANTEPRLKRLAAGLKSALQVRQEPEKSPFAAFELGTAGVFLDHPEKDHTTLHALDVVATKFDELYLNAPPRTRSQLPDPQTEVRWAIRAAVCRRWIELTKTKGWRDDMRIGRTLRKSIMTDVAKSLNVDTKFIRQSRTDFKVPKVMNAMTLESWTTEAGADLSEIVTHAHRSHATVGTAPSMLGESLERMKEMRQGGKRTPGEAMGNIRYIESILEHIAPTWSYRASITERVGVFGFPSLNPSQSFGSPKKPVAAALLPDLNAVLGQSSFIELGSSAHAGQLFIGTAKRRLLGAGVGAYAGVSSGFSVGSINGGVSLGAESIAESGAVFRTRLAGYEDPVNTTEWRKTLQQLVRTMATSGTNGELPSTPEQMWTAIVDEFYKNPCLSLNWIEREGRNRFGTASAALGARAANLKGDKTGVFLSAGVTKFSARENRRDATGNRTVQTDVRNQGRISAVGATAVASARSIEASMGPFGSTSVPSLPLLGVGVPVFSDTTASALRGYFEDGEIVPDKTFLDTEFSQPKEFLGYVDANYDEWKTALHNDRRRLDEFLTQARINGLRGNLVYGERRQLRPRAAVKINEYRNLLRTFERREQPLSAHEQQIVDDTRIKLADELENLANFRPLLLYAYETNGIEKRRGFSLLVGGWQDTAISGEREIAFIRTKHMDPSAAP